MPTSALRLSPDDPVVGGSIGDTGLLRAVPYPSPFFDIAQTYFPASVKELFQFCVYFYNTHCIIPAVVNKLASYPITEIVFATSEDELKKKWKSLFIDELNLPFELFQIGIDMSVYGNCFIGIYFPFKRFLKCKNCDSVNAFNSVEDISIKGRKLHISGTCPSCKKAAAFDIVDKLVRNIKKIKLIRYDPMSIDIICDPVSGEKSYLWDVPTAYRDGIKQGKDLSLFERCPKIVLQAIIEDKKIRLNNKNMYHMRRPSLSGQNSSWGFPLIMHALKSLYYLQVLKMAQEAIAVQHLIPLWILFPQGGSGGSALPPAQGISLPKWRATIERELQKWRKDRNYIPILNFPIGYEQIGGEGRALLLGPEVQQEIQGIIASMSVPQEFVFGGMTWTGSSITLRMLENSFQGMRDGMQRFIRFLVSAFSKYLGYKQIDIYMSELKMADDVQRQQIAMNMEAAGKISTTRLLSEFGYDFKEEEKLKKAEFGQKISSYIRDSVLQARAQGEAGMVSLDYQMRAQREQMQQAGAMQQAGMIPQAGVGQAAGAGAPQIGPDGQPIMPPVNGGMTPMQGGQGAVDPNTGLPIDPNTGLPVDPSTGLLIDVQSGTGIDPNTGQRIDLSTGQPIQGEDSVELQPQNASLIPQQQAPQGPQMDMGQQFGMSPEQQAAPVSVEQQKKQEQEAIAQQAIAAGQMPPRLKAMVTNYATALLFTDVPTQKTILADMAQETPTLAELVQQRMMELTRIDPAVAIPQPPSVDMPPGMKPTTGA